MDLKNKTEDYPELQNHRSGGNMNSNTFFSDFSGAGIELCKNWNILDIGCRTALVLNKLWELGYGNIYGLDIGLKAEESWEILPFRNNLIRCDVNQGIPFDVQFDVITISHTLEHLYDPLSVRQFIYQQLSDSGYVHSIVPMEPPHDFMEYPYHLVRFENHEEHIRFWENIGLKKIHDYGNGSNSVVICQKI